MKPRHIKKKEIHARFLLKKITKPDSLFKGHYTIDPYQNCEFGCVYCDSTYDDILYVKKNALDLLHNEITFIPKRRIIIGAVHDPYQPVEKTSKLTRSIIAYLLKNQFPIHILTKSPLILRDIDLLKKKKDVVVTFSLISNDSNAVSKLEKDAPPSHKRLQAMETLREQQIRAGIALIPILPGFINDSLEDIVYMAKKYQASYFLAKHLFLKGEQKSVFFDFLKQNYPSFIPLYTMLYKNTMYPLQSYQNKINNEIQRICAKFHLPTTIGEPNG